MEKAVSFKKFTAKFCVLEGRYKCFQRVFVTEEMTELSYVWQYETRARVLAKEKDEIALLIRSLWLSEAGRVLFYSFTAYTRGGVFNFVKIL